MKDRWRRSAGLRAAMADKDKVKEGEPAKVDEIIEEDDEFEEFEDEVFFALSLWPLRTLAREWCGGHVR